MLNIHKIAFLTYLKTLIIKNMNEKMIINIPKKKEFILGI